MRSVKFLMSAGAASLLLSSAALAADMPSIAPAPQYYAQPPADFGGWYLRGDIGMTNQRLKSLDNPDPNAALFTQTGMGFDSSTLFGLGVGYQATTGFGQTSPENIAAAPTSTVRSSPTLSPAPRWSISTAAPNRKYSILANAYVDLGTWWCVTPFIGAGVGTSYNRISNFRDDGFGNSFGQPRPFSFVYAADAGKWNLAWALHAGLAYKVTPNVTVEFAYSYVDLGDATTGANSNFGGGATAQFPWTMKNITSNDLKLGVRWNLESPPVYAPPLIRKG